MLAEGFTTGADVLAKARKAFKTEAVEVPEWGLTVHVRELTAGQRDKFEGEQVSATGPAKFKNFRARLVVLTACVPGGGLLFGEDQGRYVLAVRPDVAATVQEKAKAAGVPVSVLGETRGTALSGRGGDIVSLKRLREANEGWLPTYMAAEL